jgi:predicted metalloprotease
MRWKGREQSKNVEDRRGMARPVAGIGLGAIIIAILYLLLGGDPRQLTNVVQQPGAQKETGAGIPASDSDAEFVSVVLKETELVWDSLFRHQFGQPYREPVLVLFNQAVESACGFQEAATGPFYCPADHKAYIDLSFYRLLKERFNAPGDFAMAYVIAHEVGHHIQNLMGTSEHIQRMRAGMSEKESNRISVLMELQADFYAGLWAHYADRWRGVLEAGDIEEALQAANAIGDDRLQQEATGRVVPDAFTHGTSAQRMEWFMKGYRSGNFEEGDTFNSPGIN